MLNKLGGYVTSLKGIVLRGTEVPSGQVPASGAAEQPVASSGPTHRPHAMYQSTQGTSNRERLYNLLMPLRKHAEVEAITKESGRIRKIRQYQDGIARGLAAGLDVAEETCACLSTQNYERLQILTQRSNGLDPDRQANPDGQLRIMMMSLRSLAFLDRTIQEGGFGNIEVSLDHLRYLQKTAARIYHAEIRAKHGRESTPLEFHHLGRFRTYSDNKGKSLPLNLNDREVNIVREAFEDLARLRTSLEEHIHHPPNGVEALEVRLMAPYAQRKAQGKGNFISGIRRSLKARSPADTSGTASVRDNGGRPHYKLRSKQTNHGAQAVHGAASVLPGDKLLAANLEGAERMLRGFVNAHQTIWQHINNLPLDDDYFALWDMASGTDGPIRSMTTALQILALINTEKYCPLELISPELRKLSKCAYELQMTIHSDEPRGSLLLKHLGTTSSYIDSESNPKLRRDLTGGEKDNIRQALDAVVALHQELSDMVSKQHKMDDQSQNGLSTKPQTDTEGKGVGIQESFAELRTQPAKRFGPTSQAPSTRSIYVTETREQPDPGVTDNVTKVAGDEELDAALEVYRDYWVEQNGINHPLPESDTLVTEKSGITKPNESAHLSSSDYSR